MNPRKGELSKNHWSQGLPKKEADGG